MEERFEAAASFVAQSVGDGTIPKQALLRLYGLYKQSTEGKCTSKKPSFFDLKGREKRAAWEAIGDTPPDVAKQRYVDLLTDIKPHWEDSKVPSGTGRVFSTLETMGQDEQGEKEELPEIILATIEGDGNTVLNQLQLPGAEVNQKDSQGCTALHWAADKGHLDIIKALIQHGADIQAKDTDGMTPEEYASLAGQKEVSAYFATLKSQEL